MKDIVAFDVETTGLNPRNDFIIQLSCMLLDGETMIVKNKQNWYINPDCKYEISQQAFEKHGLTKEFLKEHGNKLKDISQDIINFFGDYDILTYNGNSFDINFLYFNLLNIGVEFDINGRNYYDAFLMYKKCHPSTLEAVYKYYTGQDLESAHNATADVEATVEIFKHLHTDENLNRLDMNEMEINHLYSPENSITLKNGQIFFNMGKYKDVEFMRVCREDPSYIKWFFNSVASLYTKQTLKKYYMEHK